MPSFEEFWAAGEAQLPTPARGGNAYERLRDEPDHFKLATPTGKIEIFNDTVAAVEGQLGHPSWMEPAEWLGSPLAKRFPLHLCSGQPEHRLHSQYDHGSWSQKHKVNGREPLLINAGDAAERGIVDGDVVRVYNLRGSCLASARVSDSIRQGVVALSTGTWLNTTGPKLPPSFEPLDLNGNPNVVTLDIGTSEFAQGTSANTTLVEVEGFDPAMLSSLGANVEMET
jgi:biotin/methionine sulfoxide reductase